MSSQINKVIPEYENHPKWIISSAFFSIQIVHPTFILLMSPVDENNVDGKNGEWWLNIWSLNPKGHRPRSGIKRTVWFRSDETYLLTDHEVWLAGGCYCGVRVHWWERKGRIRRNKNVVKRLGTEKGNKKEQKIINLNFRTKKGEEKKMKKWLAWIWDLETE